MISFKADVGQEYDAGLALALRASCPWQGKHNPHLNQQSGICPKITLQHLNFKSDVNSSKTYFLTTYLSKRLLIQHPSKHLMQSHRCVSKLEFFRSSDSDL